MRRRMTMKLAIQLVILVGVVTMIATTMLATNFPTTPPGGSAPVRPTVKVALQGETAPGTGGALFYEFDEPFVNTSGEVTFGASYGVSPTGSGIFLKSSSWCWDAHRLFRRTGA